MRVSESRLQPVHPHTLTHPSKAAAAAPANYYDNFYSRFYNFFRFSSTLVGAQAEPLLLLARSPPHRVSPSRYENVYNLHTLMYPAADAAQSSFGVCATLE
jgi:hypothetical protein